MSNVGPSGRDAGGPVVACARGVTWPGGVTEIRDHADTSPHAREQTRTGHTARGARRLSWRCTAIIDIC